MMILPLRMMTLFFVTVFHKDGSVTLVLNSNQHVSTRKHTPTCHHRSLISGDSDRLLVVFAFKMMV